MLFGPRRAVDGETAEWVLDRVSWVIGTLGPNTFFSHTKLVLPTRRFFPDGPYNGADGAGILFDTVREHMGISHWPVRLVPRAVVGAKARRRGAERDMIAGTYLHDGRTAVITYDPRLLHHRNALIGTMAHELSHYVLEEHAEAAPGGEEEHEALTDLMVVMAGFGVIDLLGARRMRWRGYLDLSARCFALAIFLQLKQLELEAAELHLDAWLKRRLRRAMRQLEDHENELSYLEALRP